MTARSAAPGPCPVCGAPPPVRRIGRPAVWCGEACRQRAFRARRNAARALQTADALSDQIAGPGYQQARDAMWEVGRAVTDMCQLPRDAAALADGHRWETDLAAKARELARAATQLAALADRHARAATDYRLARAVFRHPDVALPAADESPQSSVATTAAETSATKPGHASGADVDVDVDELFDAIEDTVAWAGKGPFGGDLNAIAGPLDRLAEAFATATGDGPLDDLVTAAAAVCAAADPAQVPLPSLADALTRLRAALPTRP
ncbi:hypothetical protein [Actinomadura sp. 6N118]|uniref:hypothetical protein n=1 Tax=Actinomadura sp. 6N118 TaxID=3375151 RepID=UPI00378DA8CD